MLQHRSLSWSAGLALCAWGANASAADLTVIVRGVPSARGHVLCAVYTVDNFLKTPADNARSMTPSVAGNVRVVFHGLAPGQYAATAFQDANDNGKLDFNSNGVPTEPTGFSNDARGIAGPPTFKQAAFTLPEGGKSITVYIE
jgi:uncharacterized protein (DUF2141 family)